MFVTTPVVKAPCVVVENVQPALVVEYVAPAPAVSYAALASSVEHVTPTTVVPYAAPAPVFKHTAPVPVDGHLVLQEQFQHHTLEHSIGVMPNYISQNLGEIEFLRKKKERAMLETQGGCAATAATTLLC